VSDLRHLIGLDVDGIHAQVIDAIARLGSASGAGIRPTSVPSA
jgi:hypothetical protein